MAKKRRVNLNAEDELSGTSLPGPNLESNSSAGAERVSNPTGRMVGKDHDQRRALERASLRPTAPSVWRGPASKAVAAYRLGYQSVITRFSFEVLFDDFVSSIYDVTDYVPNDVRFMKEAAQVLHSGAGAGAMLRLHGCLKQYQEAHAALLSSLRDPRPKPEGETRAAEVACLGAWRDLREECDRFLPPAHPLLEVYQVGVELGEFDRLASEANGLGRELPEAAPDLRHLARRALALPQTFRSFSSALTDLAQIVLHLDQEPSPATLLKFYEDHRLGWNYGQDDIDHMSIIAMAHDLAFRIDADLERMADSDWEEVRLAEAPAPEELIRPIWLSSLGILYVKGEMVRDFRGSAVNQLKVLTCFDEAGWPESPESIANPFLAKAAGNNAISHADRIVMKAKSSDTITRLNAVLKGKIKIQTKNDRLYYTWSIDPENS